MPKPPTPISRVSEETIAFFWSHTDCTAGLFDCWLWRGARYGTTEYGFVLIEGKRIGAHRLSWIIRNGPIADGLEVCHSCDTPLCVNPAHLWLGTHTQNMQDMHQKGRGPNYSLMSGELHHEGKLTWTKVREIRRLYSEGQMSQRQLAKAYGVSGPMISEICSGKYWKE